jgi:hypothetical protein
MWVTLPKATVKATEKRPASTHGDRRSTETATVQVWFQLYTRTMESNAVTVQAVGYADYVTLSEDAIIAHFRDAVKLPERPT